MPVKFNTQVDVVRYFLDAGTIECTDEKNPETVKIVDNEFCHFYQGQWRKTVLNAVPQCWRAARSAAAAYDYNAQSLVNNLIINERRQ
jgi:hypothetical protein